MGYTIKSAMNLESLIAYIDKVAAGLLSLEETRELAKAWDVLLERIEQARAARERDERMERRAGALLSVRSSSWNEALGKVSGEAYHLSGKKAGKPPYSQLFRLPAKQALGYGPTRAIEYGANLLAQAAIIAHPALKPFLDAFEIAQEALISAHTRQQEAERAVTAHSIARERLRSETQALADQTEPEILKRFPGNQDLLRAILAPSQKKRTGGTASAEAPREEAQAE